MIILKNISKYADNVVNAAGKVTDNIASAASQLKGRPLFETRRAKLAAKTAAEQAFFKGVKEVGVKGAIQGGPQYMSNVAKRTAGVALRPYKRVDPSWGNFFTGHELKGGVDKALAAGALAFGVGAGIKEAVFDDPKNSVPAEYAGTLPGLSYDAVPNAAGGRRDLGATGDLVFGLHNQRRG